ncbi:M15 family metallopeptidase [Rhodovulum euryhalinum]|uniref:D-alanyl-D-alanine carboxypeptidase-like protein n=1 Tax=Rhodovulum euryhalinum TaxID=35805 RepID=A0A4V6NP90_9RHOB|nr:M15 family metallopeptidase [Rhodovulum euryhalinum]TCO70520.1 D-alanyl-D-alanine carboxypeptidase-like protein [Rhodovulum euryhalinum]
MREGALIGPIIIAIGLVTAAVSFAVVGALLQSADPATALRLSRAEERLAVAEAGIARHASELREARADLARLRDEMSLMAGRAPMPGPEAPAFDPGAPAPSHDDVPPETEELTEVMRLARARFNTGITQPNNRAMLDLLGNPRDSYSQACQAVTNPRIKSLLETRQIGPIKVTMIRPALDSLERILARLERSDPDIHAKLGTAGALCARNIRGSSTSISNHSWGTAIDLTLEGMLDAFADGGTQFGLLILAEYFNDEGWYWGATYGREDSMHFEVGVETLKRWMDEGQLGG